MNQSFLKADRDPFDNDIYISRLESASGKAGSAELKPRQQLPEKNAGPSEATKRLGIAWRLRIGRRLPTSAQVSRQRWRNIDPHAERRQRIRNHVTASFKASFGAEYE